MARSSHPPTLLTLAKRALGSEIHLPKNVRVLVATSGGPDSMALLDVLAKLREELGFSLVAHGVDHGLRAEAAAELDVVEAHAKRLGVVFGRTRVRVEPGGNVQARARDARYAALAVAKKNARASLLATAHHAEDRAETVLMRILRGSGASGLAVLPAIHGDRVRPFIRATRQDVMLHLERHAVPFMQDPSNDDARYLRTRVRHEVLPLLAALDPNVVAHLCALADDLAPLHEDDKNAEAPFRIPRATRIALAALAHAPANSSGRAAEVRLPGNLVVRSETKTRGKKKR
jgi:tRNA(Ile)-lysidine synthase